ncbi:MAG: tRNA pseudouridine(55) synthase TruB [Proteobacteria bacterium]|nr:tRNA pseudouridine(55) synthase TruB [Pseudomonadota bacterium]
MHGFYLIHKPSGPTSAGVVGRIKWLLKQNGAPKNIKIGHGGTLDPLATGLLPIGVGKCTKQLQMLLEGPKTYTFTIQFGTQKNTGDISGITTFTSTNRPTLGQIEQTLPRFLGQIQQIPPQFSAIKLSGRKAYEIARAGGHAEIAPRTVTIHTLKLLDFQTDTATFTATVSKGTYIRTLAEDIAQALDTVGHLTMLCRTQHGPFQLHQAIPFEILDKSLQSGDITTHLLPALDEPLAEKAV